MVVGPIASRLGKPLATKGASASKGVLGKAKGFFGSSSGKAAAGGATAGAIGGGGLASALNFGEGLGDSVGDNVTLIVAGIAGLVVLMQLDD